MNSGTWSGHGYKLVMYQVPYRVNGHGEEMGDVRLGGVGDLGKDVCF